MKTIIPFFDKTTGEKSNCGDPLNITLSSRKFNWEGLLVEGGTSPYFYPKDVLTPNFYFAIELKHTYNWQIEKEGDILDFTTEPGDIWINPPNTPFTHNIDVPCNFLIVNISKERMESAFDGVLPEGLSFLNNYNIQDKTLENLMMILLDEVRNGAKNNPWLEEKIVNLLSNYFIRNYSDYDDLLNKIQQNSIIGDKELYIINHYIENHLSEGISIEQLADELNISKFHFLKEFKKFTSYTPYQHLSKKRIDIAKTMLVRDNLSITDIAYDLGFSDNSHFSRTFKKATGVSPKEFRNAKRSQL